MVEEKIVEATNSEEKDWSEEYKGERPSGESNWFSDVVQEGELSFRAEIVFLTEGEKVVNKFGKPVIRFSITHDGKEKTMEVGQNQYDYLKIVAENKPLVNKKAVHQRSGSTQKDTRRTIKFVQ